MHDGWEAGSEHDATKQADLCSTTIVENLKKQSQTCTHESMRKAPNFFSMMCNKKREESTNPIWTPGTPTRVEPNGNSMRSRTICTLRNNPPPYKQLCGSQLTITYNVYTLTRTLIGTGNSAHMATQTAKNGTGQQSRSGLQYVT